MQNYENLVDLENPEKRYLQNEYIFSDSRSGAVCAEKEDCLSFDRDIEPE